ncbi:DUF3823 domain-containing protein [Puteibacter caeruleilacunae]|nr:DUF3823 domain-containing protein [Puteibacter caeruleilacunae]
MRQLLILLAVSLMLFASCEHDNYSQPESVLSGVVHYNGKPIHVASKQVGMELYEHGWDKKHNIGINIDQDGSYSSKLFDGDYQVVLTPGQGPWKMTQADTTEVKVNGDTKLDIAVEPYYMVESANFSAAGTTVSGKLTLDQILTGSDARDIEKVFLYINSTAFVDGNGNNIANSAVLGADVSSLSDINLQVEVPELLDAQTYIFARFGIKIANTEDMLFSEAVKLDL